MLNHNPPRNNFTENGKENNCSDSMLQNLLQDSSRTFAFTLEKLPQPLSKWLRAAYLGARIIDEVEDSPLAVDDKKHIMKRIPSIFRGAGEFEVSSLESMLRGLSEEKIQGYQKLISNISCVKSELGKFPATIQDIIRKYYDEMTEGLASRATQYIQTLEDHHRYCHYAAGTIGYMVTELTQEVGYFTVQQVRTKLMPFPDNWKLGVNPAHDFALGLQLTNDIRDLHKDVKEGIYRYPQDLLNQESLTYEKLLNTKEEDKENLEKAYKILKPQIEDAKQYILSANTWLDELPFSPIGLRQAWGDTLAMSAATLRTINTPAFFYNEEYRKISQEEVKCIDEKTRELTEKNKTMLPFLEHLFNDPVSKYDVDV